MIKFYTYLITILFLFVLNSCKQAEKQQRLSAEAEVLFAVHLVLYLLHVGVLGYLKQKIKRDANKISGITKGALLKCPIFITQKPN